MRMERLEYMDYLRKRKEEEKKMEAELDRLTKEILDRLLPRACSPPATRTTAPEEARMPNKLTQHKKLSD